jgi:hypothetical protein
MYYIYNYEKVRYVKEKVIRHQIQVIAIVCKEKTTKNAKNAVLFSDSYSMLIMLNIVLCFH